MLPSTGDTAGVLVGFHKAFFPWHFFFSHLKSWLSRSIGMWGNAKREKLQINCRGQKKRKEKKKNLKINF